MEPWVAALVNLGVGGIGLYLFAKGLLLSKETVAQLVAAVTEAFNARLVEWKERYDEMREDRDAWRELALGNERSVDLARPIVAEAAGVPEVAPPAVPARGSRVRTDEGYTAGDTRSRRRQRR